MQLRPGRWIRGLNGLVRQRGLIGIHLSARVRVQGRFIFGRGVSIGASSLIQVPEGARLTLGDEVRVGRQVEISAQSMISVGSFTSLQDRCQLHGEVSVGASVVFAPNVFVSSGSHQFLERPAWLIRDQDALVADPAYRAAEARRLPVVIEDDCWLGVNSVITPGVTIGRGCVVGANSVVTDSIAPYSVVAGTPARVLRQRLDFRPPRAISSHRPEDLPYFYAGFDQRQCALTAAGWRAHGRFELALASAGARALRLQLEASQPLVLRCAGQETRVPAGARDVLLVLEPYAPAGRIALEVLDSRGRPCSVTVARASLED